MRRARETGTPCSRQGVWPCKSFSVVLLHGAKSGVAQTLFIPLEQPSPLRPPQTSSLSCSSSAFRTPAPTQVMGSCMSAQSKSDRPRGPVKTASTFGPRHGSQNGFLGVCDSVYGFEGAGEEVDEAQEGDEGQAEGTREASVQ